MTPANPSAGSPRVPVLPLSPASPPPQQTYVTTAETIKLAPELNSSITTILRSKDPLDAQEFSSVEYINRIFPNEKSLVGVDQVLLKLQAKAKQVQEELRELTRAQTDGGQKGQEEVEAAKKGIEQLFMKIKEIKEKATQSEQMVQEITQDIKSLDFAKRHLTMSITTLKRLQMLVTAVDQLRNMAQRKHYRESAQLLEAVLQLAQYFRTFQNVKQIAELTQSIARLQADLEKDIMKDFSTGFTPEGILVGNAGQLGNACLVVEVLGPDVRDQLVDWYCNLQLKSYRAVFRLNEEVSELDNTSRRFAWLKRLLKIHDEEHSIIFPPLWDVSKVLCLKFCQTTRADISEILAKTAATVGVPTLLQALQLTLEFETQLESRFLSKDIDYASNEEPEPAGFIDSISPCFEPCLGLYIDAEDHALEEKIKEFKIKEPTSPEDDPSLSVLASSTDIFLFYKSALTNCAKISRKKPFLNLCKVFAKWLRVYANDILMAKLPKPRGTVDPKRPGTANVGPAVINREYLRSICIVLNTADYSLTTTNQLEERLWANIDPDFVGQVSLETEKQAFLAVIAACTRALVQAVEQHYEGALMAMTKVQWATLDFVGDQSEYVGSIQQTLKTCVGAIQELVANKRYFRTFCDKFVESVVARFATNMVRCRPICEIGAEQMLLDTQAVKTLLIEMPNLNLAPPLPPVPGSFIKYVTRGLAKVETILKTTLRPHDPPEMFIDHYFLLIADRNFYNFQRILDLKGLKRAEQQQLVDLFQQKQVGMETLQENSPVMSLLQNSPAYISASGVVGTSAGMSGTSGGGGSGHGSGNTAGGLVGPGSVVSGFVGSGVNNILSHSPFSSGGAANHVLSGSGIGGAFSISGSSRQDQYDGGSLMSNGGGPNNSSSGNNNANSNTNSNISHQSAGGMAGQSDHQREGAYPGSTFAAGAKINVNIRKFVAGIRAKKDEH